MSTAPMEGTGMMEWQPIETAPKDGTPILVWNGPANYGYYTAPDQMGTARWDRQAFTDGEMCWWACDCCDGVTTYNPTHWMPLPEPPK